jgi:glycosyltransferase involved in cell wall biosynthesis
MKEGRPLVSVGIPTHNRTSQLKRAVESVLSQDYENIELIISDDGLTDQTRELCVDFCQRDQRVRYIRQPGPLGIAKNFLEALKPSQGPFFMWLADDDWLDHAYISKCLSVLLNNPDHTLVCGKGRYFEKQRHVFDEEVFKLLDQSGRERVLCYCRQVGINGMLYGLIRRELLDNVEFDNALGGDWLIVARIAFAGKALTLDDVSINRSVEGASQNLERLARSDGLSGVMARNPLGYVAYMIFRDLAWRAPVYSSLGVVSRFFFGLQAAAIILNRYVWSPRLPRIRPVWDGLRSKLIIRTRIRKGLRSLQGLWKSRAEMK